MLDGNKFPLLSQYLASLPDGLASYPECLAKASMIRNVADERPVLRADMESLPEVLRRMCVDPLPVSSWIPEVQSQAMMLAVFESRFDDEPAFAAFNYVRGKALLEGPLYAIAFKIASASLLLRSATLRWRMFHRGATLALSGGSPGRATARIEHPPGLFHAVVLQGVCEGMRAALDLATKGGATAEVSAQTPDGATLQFSWVEA